MITKYPVYIWVMRVMKYLRYLWSSVAARTPSSLRVTASHLLVFQRFRMAGRGLPVIAFATPPLSSASLLAFLQHVSLAFAC